MIIGITFSTFDLFHAGHVSMLHEAKQKCDYLIVGLQSDPTIDRPQKNAPIQSLFERYVQLKGCRYVDEIVPYTRETDLEDIMLTYDIHKRFIGEEYKMTNFTGKSICGKRDIEIVYNQRKHSFSTTNLRERVVERYIGDVVDITP